MTKRLIIIILFSLFIGASPLYATEFRTFRPILTPAAVGIVRKAEVFQPVPREIIEKAIHKIVSAWNEKHLASVIGEEFYERERLLDSMDVKVPRNAELRLLSIQSSQTLAQEVKETEHGKIIESTVSVIINTEVNYDDPVKGYQRIEGTNELIIRLKYRSP